MSHEESCAKLFAEQDKLLTEKSTGIINVDTAELLMDLKWD